MTDEIGQFLSLAQLPVLIFSTQLRICELLSAATKPICEKDRLENIMINIQRFFNVNSIHNYIVGVRFPVNY